MIAHDDRERPIEQLSYCLANMNSSATVDSKRNFFVLYPVTG